MIDAVKLTDINGRVLKVYDKDFKSIYVGGIVTGQYILEFLLNEQWVRK